MVRETIGSNMSNTMKSNDSSQSMRWSLYINAWIMHQQQADAKGRKESTQAAA